VVLCRFLIIVEAYPVGTSALMILYIASKVGMKFVESEVITCMKVNGVIGNR
jgi:hypothetical protein